VHLPDRDISSLPRTRNKLYVADLAQPVVAVTRAHTKAEESQERKWPSMSL